MALTINTNLSSMLVQKNMNASTTALNTAIQRMTTGYRINSAKDDAAGMAVSIKLDTQLSGYDVASQNVQMGSAMLTTVEENSNLVLGHLQRIRDLAEQCANDVYDDSSKKAIEAEINARMDEINRLADSVEFNGKNLMDGTKTINIQVGINGGADDHISLSSATGSAKIASILADYQSGGAITANATAALTKIDTAIGTIKTRITTIGALQNRLDSAAESIEVARSNISSALSTVRDADVSTESSNYIRAQILQQSAAALLTTANQSPSIALNLI